MFFINLLANKLTRDFAYLGQLTETGFVITQGKAVF